MANIFAQTDPSTAIDPNRNKKGFFGIGTPGGLFGFRKVFDPSGFQEDFDATFNPHLAPPDVTRTGTPSAAFIEATGGQDPLLLAQYNELVNAGVGGPAFLLNERSARETRERGQQAREEAIKTLTGSKASIQSLLDNQTALDFRVVSPLEEQLGSQQIAQQGSTGVGSAISSAANRGVLQSGATLQNVAGIRAQTAAQDVQFRAGVSGQNREARNTLELGLTRALAEIDAEIAKIQNDVQYIPADFLPFSQLAFGADQFNRQSDLLEQQAGFNIQDFIRLGLQLPGSGIPEAAGDFFQNIFRPRAA